MSDGRQDSVAVVHCQFILPAPGPHHGPGIPGATRGALTRVPGPLPHPVPHTQHHPAM